MGIQSSSAATITITSPTSTTNVSAGPITVTGTAQPTKNVKLYANNTLVGTAKVGNDSKWSISANLTDPSSTLRADLYDDPMGFLNVFSGPLSLIKFDTSNNSVTNSLPAGLNALTEVRFHPTQHLAYILDKANAVVVVINTQTQRYVTSIDLGTYGLSVSGPTNLAISPDGSKLYVVVATNKIVVINTANNTVASTATVGSNPGPMGLSSDGSKLYVVDGTNVLVLNASSLANIDTVDMTNSCYDLVIDNADSKALVACDNGTSGQIEPIDLSNDTVGTSVPYTSGAANTNDRMAITDDDSLLYVGSHSDNDIQYFTPSSMAAGPSSPIQSIADPYEIVFTPDGAKAYVSSDQSQNVVVINTNDQSHSSIDASKNNDGKPLALASSPDGTQIYASRYNAGDIALINTTSDTITGSISASYNGYSLAITKDGTKAYVSAFAGGNLSGDGTLSQLDLVNNQIDWTVPVGVAPVGVALNKDETKAYVADSAKDSGLPEVSVVDLTNHALKTTIDGIGNQPFAVVYDQLTDRVYVGGAGGSSISVIDPTTDTKESTGITAAGVLGLAVSPDGSKLYATAASSNFYVINPVDKTVVTKTDDGAAYDVLTSYAGTKVYLADAGSAKIDIYDVASGTFDTPINTGGIPFGLGITPDDSKLFVTSINSTSVKAINLSDNSVSSFSVNGQPSAFGNFVTQTLLASTSVVLGSGSLAATGQRLLTIPLLVIIVVAGGYLAIDGYRGKKRLPSNQ